VKEQQENTQAAPRSRPLLGGVIVLYFVIALEVLIMISPFAAFFYAAFNPVLLFLAQWPATEWLSAFFLPHMVMPPDMFLMAVRVKGSVLFVGGTLAFLVCAAQVYFHKFAGQGPVLGGLYRWIRHPQYLALAVTGAGLAILWPRFLTAALWAVMVTLYYLLAKDEERRMVAQFGDQYRAYMEKTGLFVPRSVEWLFGRVPLPKKSALRTAVFFLVAFALSVGTAFGLRAYTVGKLPLWSDGRVTVLPILTADGRMLEHRMSDVLQLPEVRSRLEAGSGAILGYFVPQGYVMQGMIADTDPAWRLYEHHQTLAMITDWVFHPFRHLEGGHAMMHTGTGGSTDRAPSSGTIRRIIFLRVQGRGTQSTAAGLFSINAKRTPQFFVDVDIHELTLLNVKDLGPGTGWGLVPTPMF
jgi:protein-S-isoprenylcysteine O-methyltransferase Ste14